MIFWFVKCYVIVVVVLFFVYFLIFGSMMRLVSCCALFVFVVCLCFCGCLILLKWAYNFALDYVRFYQCFLGVFFEFLECFLRYGCLWVVILFELKCVVRMLYSVLWL